MHSSDLLNTCIISFSAVFIILVFLAIVMRVIIAVFPQKLIEKVAAKDTAMYAALTAVAAKIYPGKVITNIEETK